MALEHGDPLSKLIRVAGRREPVPTDARDRVRAAVHGEWRGVVRRRNMRRWSLWVASTVAAGIVVGLLLANFRTAFEAPVATVAFVEGHPSSSHQNALSLGGKISKGDVISTGQQDRIAVKLSGGQSLRLDLNSRVKILAPDTIVLEAGALYSDSSSAKPGSALEIRTDAGIVRDIGTQFEVREQYGGVRVRVREGSISLEQKAAKTEAKAGEQLSATADKAPVRGAVSPDSPEWQWASSCAPAFELEGATLGDFLKWAAREQGVNIEYANNATRDAIAPVKLHGSMQGMTPQQALDSVLPASGLSYQVRAGVLTVSLER